MTNLSKEHLSFDSEHRLRAENLPFDIVSSACAWACECKCVECERLRD